MKNIPYERKMTMDLGEGIKVAMFCIAMVFMLLALIYALIKLSSAVIRRYFSS